MKRRFASLAVFAAVCLFATASLAQNQNKFAYVDMQRALDQIDEGKAIKAELKAEFDGKQVELDRKQEELKKEYTSLDALAREGVCSSCKFGLRGRFP